MSGGDGAPVDAETMWRQLVTAALLGTDRREPPELPPSVLADAVADAMRPDAATRLLATVALVTAARRAAFVPLPAADPLQPPPVDERPWCSPQVANTWRDIVSEWPVLEDEWVLTVIETGRRLPPDVLVDMLVRHRSDPVRRTRAHLAGGPLAGWVVGHIPALEPSSARAPSPEAVAELPQLAIPPDLAELLAVDAHTFVQRLMPGFHAAGYGPSHKPVLVNLLARCRPAVLVDVAESLDSVRSGLAIALADLCRLRHRMLTELATSP